MIYEFCTYTMPNPMKMQVMLDVIEACVPYYEKHGMRLVGVWHNGRQVGANMNQVLYVLEFDDYRQLDEQWAALRSDPEWKAEEVRVAGGDFSFISSAEHMVKVATDFCPDVLGAQDRNDGQPHIFELKTFTAPHSGAMAPLVGTVQASLPFFERHGFDVVGTWTTLQTISDNCNTASFILRWRDLGHFEESWTAMRLDHDWGKAFMEVTGGDLGIIQKTANFMMAPATFSPLQ